VSAEGGRKRAGGGTVGRERGGIVVGWGTQGSAWVSGDRERGRIEHVGSGTWGRCSVG